MPEQLKKAPSTVDEARAALQIVQLGNEFYIACRNPFQEAKLYRIVFYPDATYEMYEAYQKSQDGNN